mgnify:CR=1 FL=1
MVHFVGAGPGAPDLITVRGKKLLEEADMIIYAGSLVNPQLLDYATEKCKIYDSSKMTLEQVIETIVKAHEADPDISIVRLHTGDPSIYGAIREQMDELDKHSVTYDDCPGVSSFFGAAACKWNIRCLMFPRVLLSQEWQAEHRFLQRKVLHLLRHIRQLWCFS